MHQEKIYFLKQACLAQKMELLDLYEHSKLLDIVYHLLLLLFPKHHLTQSMRQILFKDEFHTCMDCLGALLIVSFSLKYHSGFSF